MAVMTNTAQVLKLVGATFSARDDVIHFDRARDEALRFAYFTDRLHVEFVLTNATPSMAVAADRSRTAAVVSRPTFAELAILRGLTNRTEA
jgi:hypothetical protein